MRLIDHADCYLSRFRGDAWLSKHVTANGRWPGGEEPFIAITFHWGAGMWAVRHMRSQGRKASVLVRGVDRETFPGTGTAYSYAKLRLSEVTRAGGSEIVLSSGTSLFEMRRTLKKGHCVVGAIDVPVLPSQSCVPVELLGKTAYFPRGLLHLALKSNVPTVVYSMGIEEQTGQRMLEISDPLQFNNEAELLQNLSETLNELIGF